MSTSPSPSEAPEPRLSVPSTLPSPGGGVSDPIAAADGGAAAGGEGDTIEGGEEEEEEECGFCIFMKAGGCKDTFVGWEKCVEEAEKAGEDVVEKCMEVTSLLKKCMDAHADYYEPILRAEQAMADAVSESDHPNSLPQPTSDQSDSPPQPKLDRPDSTPQPELDQPDYSTRPSNPSVSAGPKLET